MFASTNEREKERSLFTTIVKRNKKPYLNMKTIRTLFSVQSPENLAYTKTQKTGEYCAFLMNII